MGRARRRGGLVMIVVVTLLTALLVTRSAVSRAQGAPGTIERTITLPISGASDIAVDPTSGSVLMLGDQKILVAGADGTLLGSVEVGEATSMAVVGSAAFVAVTVPETGAQLVRRVDLDTRTVSASWPLPAGLPGPFVVFPLHNHVGAARVMPWDTTELARIDPLTGATSRWTVDHRVFDAVAVPNSTTMVTNGDRLTLWDLAGGAPVTLASVPNAIGGMLVASPAGDAVYLGDQRRALPSLLPDGWTAGGGTYRSTAVTPRAGWYAYTDEIAVRVRTPVSVDQPVSIPFPTRAFWPPKLSASPDGARLYAATAPLPPGYNPPTPATLTIVRTPEPPPVPAASRQTAVAPERFDQVVLPGDWTPTDLVVDTAGRVFVAHAEVVRSFTANGTPVHARWVPGLMGLATAPDTLFAVQRAGSRILRLDPATLTVQREYVLPPGTLPTRIAVIGTQALLLTGGPEGTPNWLPGAREGRVARLDLVTGDVAFGPVRESFARTLVVLPGTTSVVVARSGGTADPSTFERHDLSRSGVTPAATAPYTLESEPVVAAPSGDNLLIGRHGAVVTAALDGAGIEGRPLGNAGPTVALAATTANGGWIAAANNRWASDPRQRDLYLFRTTDLAEPARSVLLDGLDPRQHGLAWRPDGSGLYLLAGQRSSSTVRLVLVPVGAVAHGGAGEFHPLVPERVLDTRIGTGRAGVVAPIGPSETIEVAVTGRAGIPTHDVLAVVLNVTAVAPTAVGYLSVYPGGSTRPLVSNLNLAPGVTRANLVLARVGPGGTVSIFNANGTTHVVADVAGYLTTAGGQRGSRFSPMNPERLLDTRAPGYGPITPDRPAILDLNAYGPLWPTTNPSKAVPTAVALNVTVVGPTTTNHVTVHPTWAPKPLASNVNTDAGDTVPNAVFARVGPDGRVLVSVSSGATHLVVDLLGTFHDVRGDETGRILPVATPYRSFDTRPGGAPLGPMRYLSVGMAGWPVEAPRLPSLTRGTGGLVLNATVTEPTSSGHLTVYPGDLGNAPPLASNANFRPGQTVASFVVVRNGGQPPFPTLPGTDRVNFANANGSIHLIADVFGMITNDRTG